MLTNRSTIYLIIGVLFSAMTTVAQADLIDYDGVPLHQGHVAFEKDGFHHHHFHSKQHKEKPRDAQEGHDVAHQLSGNEDYDAAAVWVNEKYMRFDGTNTIGKRENSTAPDSLFSHGFIMRDDKNMPEYQFFGKEKNLFDGKDINDDKDMMLFDVDGKGFDPLPMVRKAFETWSGITEDDPHLILGLGFREFKEKDDAAEIAVQFVDELREIAAWAPGTRPREFPSVKGTLSFRRYRVFDPFNSDNNVKEQWFTGERREDIANDKNVRDLLTVALHEVGHIIGLDHQNDTDDIMHTFAGDGDQIRAGGVYRKLSGDDILGARDLYSIPAAVPEPSTLTLLGMGVLCLCFYSWRRQRRAA